MDDFQAAIMESLVLAEQGRVAWEKMGEALLQKACVGSIYRDLGAPSGSTKLFKSLKPLQQPVFSFSKALRPC